MDGVDGLKLQPHAERNDITQQQQHLHSGRHQQEQQQQQQHINMHEDDQKSSPAPLAGPGTTRANRRLQLRKTGFRGLAVQRQQRNITPTNNNNNSNHNHGSNRQTSGSWSSPANNNLGALLSELSSSDSRNMHDRNETDGRPSSSSSSSNILLEVNSSSLRRKGRGMPGRSRTEPMVSIFHDENAEAEGEAYDAGRQSSSRQLESSPAW